MSLRLIILCFISFSATADVTNNLISTPGFEQAWKAELKAAPAKHLQHILYRAEAGDSDAGWWLVTQSLKPDSPLFSRTRARFWLQKFADAGRPDAQFLLGKMLLIEPATEASGLKWLRAAAEQDWVPAMLLIHQYSGGRVWLQRAATLGNPEAQFLLAAELSQSDDFKDGIALLTSAAEQDYLPAIKKLLEYSSSQNNSVELQRWLSRLDNNKSAAATTLFVHTALDNRSHDYTSLVRWLMTRGYSELDAIGVLSSRRLRTGLAKPGVNQQVKQLLGRRQYVQARDLMEAEIMSLSAQHIYRLGYLYRSGVLGYQDYQRAREYYYRAAVLGSASAFNSLGVLYEKRLVPGESNGQFKQAAAFYEEAARRGDQRGRENLAHLQVRGLL